MSTIEARVAEIEKLLSSSDEAKRAEAVKLYNEFRKKYPKIYPGEISVPTCPPGQHYDSQQGKCVVDTPPGCPELPLDGRPQPQKGANHRCKYLERCTNER